MDLIGISAQGRRVGEFVHNAKLSFKTARELRHLRSLGWTYDQLGKRFGVHEATAGKVATGKSWIVPAVAEIHSVTQTDISTITALAAKGYGCARIGKLLNATKHSVHALMRANGLQGHSLPVENARRVVCKRGHPLSGDNLCTRSDGARVCIACRRARDNRRYKETKKYAKNRCDQ